MAGANIDQVPNRRQSTGVYTELERAVLEYAEAMTGTEPTVTDELAARPVAALGEPAFVELTMTVALEDLRSRVNSAFGLTSQGFAAACAVRPPAARPTTAA
ncbi:carboxymuconolactone decarboxylase family protein [Kitasatospora sp. LaBMicrA B282]|uniref:carboxymuconolactone decarboxylase family protein n=1 Tax=Kitasatospora sp. LaBMicrA B282 TaxID=3420949 RepID=UPI003D09F30B